MDTDHITHQEKDARAIHPLELLDATMDILGV